MLAKIKNTNWQRLHNLLFTGLVCIAVIVVIILFIAIVGQIIVKGFSEFNFKYLYLSASQSGRAGGIGPIIISTLWILLICLCVTIPLGLGTAIFITEFTQRNSKSQRFISRSLDALSGIPSIVFGLFGNVFFCKVLDLGFSILSGGLTLACMALPLFIRSTEIGLRSVPAEYRLGGLALGYSWPSLLWYVLLPSAVPGIITGIVLGIGRALAETAALIFTSGYVDRMPESMMDSGRALSVHIYDLSMNISGGDINAYKSSFVLILIILFLNNFAMTVTKKVLLRQRGET